jgi:hypothetical protein
MYDPRERRVPSFTDRDLGARRRTAPEIEERVRSGLIRPAKKWAGDGSFGLGFPDYCADRES